ncbi:MAG: hypothetical protein ACRD5R_11150 [Candidatus Acidiferrales bacterium]
MKRIATVILTLLVLTLIFLPPAFAQPSRTAALREKFTRETNPVHKARDMQALGDAEFRDLQAEFSAGNLSGALTIFQQYRDEVNIAWKALDASQHDPDKHPGGYKELEISVRETIERLDEALVPMTADQQKPFLEIRKELDTTDHRLIHELFPRQPGAQGVGTAGLKP